MRKDTNEHHGTVVELGQKLGFAVRRELSIASEAGSDGYSPRLDIAWLLPLSSACLEALNAVGARVPTYDEQLLVAGWEVEASDVSTRGMQADLANLRASGAAFAFLALTGGTPNNLYERARKMARTQRHYFGFTDSIVLDTRWLEELNAGLVTSELPPAALGRAIGVKTAVGGGGESDWAKQTRRALRQLGEQAGFGVTESFSSRLGSKPGLTKSQIDLVWSLPLPGGLFPLVQEVERRARDEHADELVAERYADVPVVAFELENDDKQHACGALLNLASHALAGVFIGGNSAAVSAAEAVKRTYGEVFPLKRVTVNGRYKK